MQPSPHTPKEDKENEADNEKEKGMEKEKEEKGRHDKRNEETRAQNKKAQNSDLPRFRTGENEIKTNTDTYEIIAELGQGSFGAVYEVIRKSDKAHLAMKCESVHMRRAILPHEAGALLSLNLLRSPHFIEMTDQGLVNNRFLFVVLKLVGANLWDVRASLPEKRFTLSTALKIAEQTLAGIRDLHRQVGFLHRDIKPPNFSIGRREDDSFHTIFVLDLGLCRRIALKGKDLRTPRKDCAFRGTTRYASLAAHFGKEQSRKDDVESWWYMVAEMISTELPWKTIRGPDRDAVRQLKKRLRRETTVMKFLFRKCCYEQMSSILLYIDKLKYESIPDYDFVRRNVQSAAIANNCSPDEPPDWDVHSKTFKGPPYKENEPYIVKELESSYEVK